MQAKTAYLVWDGCYQILPRPHRHSLGERVDGLFVEVIEAITFASFLGKAEKAPYVRLAIRKLDTLKVLLMVLWETKSIDNKKYALISVPIETTGRMLGGWYGQLQKQNSPATGEK